MPRTSSTTWRGSMSTRVNEMAGGRLEIEYLIAGAVVKPFSIQDAVNDGVLDGGHHVTAYWYGKNKAASLFGTSPVWGWNAHQGHGLDPQGRRAGALRRADPAGPGAQRRRLLRPADADPAARLVQERAQGRRRPQGPEVPHSRPRRRRHAGDGHGGGAAARRRDPAGDGARRDRRLRVQQPDLRPPVRRAGRLARTT